MEEDLAPLKLQWKVVPWNDPANKPIHSRDNIIPLIYLCLCLTTPKSQTKSLGCPAIYSTEEGNIKIKISAVLEAGSLIPDLNQLFWAYLLTVL